MVTKELKSKIIIAIKKLNFQCAYCKTGGAVVFSRTLSFCNNECKNEYHKQKVKEYYFPKTKLKGGNK